jgi:hypothetical protein
MHARSHRGLAPLVLAAAMAAFVPAAALAQAADGGGYVPPRTPWGDPDISGMYEPGWIGQPAENPVGERWTPPRVGIPGRSIGPTDFGAREAAENDTSRAQITPNRNPMVIDPPDGKIPMQPWVAEMRKVIYENQHKAEYLDPRVRCLQSGVPRANMPVYYNSYQILQKPGYVVIVYEWNHMTRIIPLDGRPHLDPRIRLPMGDSRGRWEGNTLVVDITNFNDDTWVLGHGAIGDGQPSTSATSGHGIVHSPDLRVVERFTPVDGDIIRYQATIEDPKAFTRPFTIEFDVMVRGRADHEIFEYACHEGNREGILLATGVDIDPAQANK